MPSIAVESAETTFKPGPPGFYAFCEAIGADLAPFQRRIVRAHFAHRKVVAILPKGNFKTTTCALIGLHHLLTVPGAEVRIGAASRRQAEICLKRMKGFARHPLVHDLITITHFELRVAEGDLMVVSAEGELLHGDSPTLLIGDEVWAWKERGELLEAMESSLLKRPDSRLILISTSAPMLDSPLGALRDRALSQRDVKRRGVVTEAKGDDLHWLEWSLGEEDSLADMAKVKQANPAAYITRKALRAQLHALGELKFGQFHACKWGVGEAAWLPPGAWDACAGDAAIEPGEKVTLGIDIGGKRSASAIAIVTPDLRVNTEIYQGEAAVLKVVERIHALAKTYAVERVVYDPMRFASEALRLEEDGFELVEYPQGPGRLTVMSEVLLGVIVEKRLTHPNDPELNTHVARAIAVQTDRGWRLSKARETDQIDAVVAVGMAVDVVDRQPKPTPPQLAWV